MKARLLKKLATFFVFVVLPRLARWVWRTKLRRRAGWGRA